MTRIEAIAVLADWLEQHRPPATPGWWHRALGRIVAPDPTRAPPIKAILAIDALWTDAPPVLRDLLWAAGMVPHGPSEPTEEEWTTIRDARYAFHIRQVQAKWARRAVAQLGRMWPETA